MHKSSSLISAKTKTIYFLAIIVFIIGVMGWMDKGNSFSDAIYKTLRFVALNGDGNEMGWELEIARFVLPALTIGAIIQFIYHLFSFRVLLYKLRLNPKEIIVFGAENATARAVTKMNDQANKLFISLSELNLMEVTDIKTTVIHFNESQVSEFIHKIPFCRAKEIYILTPDFTQNIRLAKILITILNTSKSKPHIIIQLNDKELLRILSKEDVFSSYKMAGGKVSWYNEYRDTSRILLKNYPPLSISSLKHRGKIHVGIAGFNEFNQELLINLAIHMVYFSKSEIIISLFSDDVEKFNQFIMRHSILNSNGSPLFGGLTLNFSVKHHTLSTNASSIVNAIKEDGDFTAFYLSDNNDYELLRNILKVRQGLVVTNSYSDCLLVACLLGNQLDLSNIQHLTAENEVYRNVHFFSISDKNLDIDYRNVMDLLAKSVHTAYKILYEYNMDITFNAELFSTKFLLELNNMDVWDYEISEDDRYSSQYSADHFFVKLRELGYELVQISKENRINLSEKLVLSDIYIEQLKLDIEKNIEQLNQLEHRRFYHERFISGWIYGTMKNKPLLINETLVPFDCLSENEKNKDEIIMRVIPFILSHPSIKQFYYLTKKEN